MSFSFPSHSQAVGMFFYSLPVPLCWEHFFSIPFLFPNFRNGIIYYRSRTPTSHSRSPPFNILELYRVQVPVGHWLRYNKTISYIITCRRLAPIQNSLPTCSWLWLLFPSLSLFLPFPSRFVIVIALNQNLFCYMPGLP